MSYNGLFVAAFSLFLAACNDGSSSNDKGTAIAVIADDYMQNVVVCSDCNKNMLCDIKEKQSTSNEDGFVFSNELDMKCPLLANVALDSKMKATAKQSEVEFKMVSPVGCENISPMSSLLSQEISSTVTKPKAKNALKLAMLTDLDICMDFLEIKNDSDATPFEKHEAEIYKTISQDYIADYSRRSELIEQNSDLSNLSGKYLHELITYRVWRRLDKYRSSPTLGLTTSTSTSSQVVNNNDSSDDEAGDLGYENYLNQELDDATSVNLFFTFNGNTGADLIRFHEDLNELKTTSLRYNDGVLTEFQNYFKPAQNETIERPSVLGKNGYLGITSSNDSLTSLSIYYDHKFFDETIQIGAVSEQINGLELTNRTYKELDYVLTSDLFFIEGLPVRILMDGFGGISSWAKATKGSDITFPDNNSSFAYRTNVVPLVNTVIFEDTGNCSPQADDPISNLCNYIDVIRPNVRTKGAKKVSTYFNTKTKSGYIYQATVDEIPDVLYLGTIGNDTPLNGTHLLAYKFSKEEFKIAFVKGDLNSITLEENGSSENINLKFFNGAEDITNNDLYATANWGISNVNGHEIAVITIPNSIRQLLPQLPRLLAITKLGGFDRYGDFVQRFGARGQELLGVDQTVFSVVEEALNQSQSK
ncbi:hypothetical protein D5018_18745 [Parashewanella curva]|uniref:Uncharacterized protein n=1 Tax=Parashewanella curva TaxID=2338552 RepID=A0A3L8PUQ7_9GAMM|nr:hypothetical protein [Parashewanella curva]RLV58158.1 hypothetical protein D5018_18745 [Parashewanella curva]